MDNIFKDIVGYEGLYQVSNTGIVISIGKGRGRKLRTLKQHHDSNGYKEVSLYLGSKRTHYRIHQLVINAFNPTNDIALEVNHIDGNKQNNSINNLEWVTHSENNKHAFRIGLRSHKGTLHNRAKFNESQIKEIKAKYKTGEYTQKQLAKIYNVSKYNICDLVNNRSYRECID